MPLLATAPPRRDCPAPVADPALVSTPVLPRPSAWPSGPQPLANRTVVLAVRAADRSEAIAAFSAAGAVVRAVTDLASLRSDAAFSGPQALVVADLRALGDQLRTSLPALARQEAVVVLAGTLTSAERVACLRPDGLRGRRKASGGWASPAWLGPPGDPQPALAHWGACAHQRLWASRTTPRPRSPFTAGET